MKEPAWTIYCHIHKVTGRRYVGLTIMTWRKRWNRHIYSAMRSKGGRWHFPNAIRKYGPEAFDHEVLGVCDTLEEANAAEEKWIDHFDSTNPEKGFNLAKGGAHTPHPLGRNPWDRPEYRKKQIARLRSEEWKSRMNRPDTKAKMSAASSSRTYSDEVRAKVAEAGRGREVLDETRQKISASLSGRKLSRDHVKKIKDALLGRQVEFSAAGNAAILANPKTHCKHGHSLSDAYVMMRANGRTFRRCRTCEKIMRERKRDMS